MRRAQLPTPPVGVNWRSVVAPSGLRPVTLTSARPGSAEADSPEVKVAPMPRQPLQTRPSKWLREPRPLGVTANTSRVPLPSDAACWAMTVPPRSVEPTRRPAWYHVCTTDPVALRVSRSTRPAADDAAEGALVEVTPAPAQPAQVAPSSALRRSRDPVAGAAHEHADLATGARQRHAGRLHERARGDGGDGCRRRDPHDAVVGAVRGREPQGTVRTLHDRADPARSPPPARAGSSRRRGSRRASGSSASARCPGP